MRILITIAVLSILTFGCPPQVQVEHMPNETCAKPLSTVLQ